jgi:hypothetical protein
MLLPLTVIDEVLLSDLEPLDRVESEPVVPPELDLRNPRLASESVHVTRVHLPPLGELLGGEELRAHDTHGPAPCRIIASPSLPRRSAPAASTVVTLPLIVHLPC